MLRNIVKIIITMIWYIAVIASPYAFAKTTYVPVEIQCSRHPMRAQWTTFDGIPGVQYTLTTMGLRKDGSNEIDAVVDTGGVGRTYYGLYVHAGAMCTVYTVVRWGNH